jgi:hypothetical protein
MGKLLAVVTRFLLLCAVWLVNLEAVNKYFRPNS